jgi:hypothetical protein
MSMFLGIIGFIGFVVFASMGIISLVRKTKTTKRNFMVSGVLFVVFVVAAVSSGSSNENSKKELADQGTTSSSDAKVQTADAQIAKVDPEAEAKKKADDEAKAQADADAKAKADAAAKAKAEADTKKAAEEAARKAKSFDGNGTFAVNDEIKPGLYRAEEGIAYWARTSGFGGELDDIISNGSPSGPAVVEIKATDKGFQTNGSGEWTLVDSTYQPTKLTEFGNGTYLVGKDIDPGTYKSDDGVIYWARLKNFLGGVDSINANGSPQGSEIVEIKATDKGFETNGGGTWKKIK